MEKNTMKIFIIHGSSRTGMLTKYAGTILSETGNPKNPYLVQPEGTKTRRALRTPAAAHILKIWKD